MKLKTSHRSGVALVIVLGFLVIISALAVAFFSSVTTELKASRNFASGVTTRQLADSAVNIVMGQIRGATARDNSAWASQPGMIRVYGESGKASTRAEAFVKLYSSNEMIVTNADLHAASTYQTKVVRDVADDWDTKPALWADLNSPVVIDEEPRFPIIDPRAYVKYTPKSYTTILGDQDPDSPDNVEGFWYDIDSTVNGIVGPSGSATDPATLRKQRLPMPVRWIYVLKDGTLTIPQDGTGAKAEWTTNSASALKPTQANPIVGRMAFWTDDETCKVNLNTAGGFVDPELDTKLQTAGYDRTNYAGSYWDTPRFYSEFDRGMPYRESLKEPKAGRPQPGKGGLSICQLLQNEFQRYPGHPATTSLGIIFGNFLTAEQMYYVLPRFGTTSNNGTSVGNTSGSTEGGTQRIIPYNPVANANNANPYPKDLQIKPKSERLYASVDELVFAADSPLALDDTYQRITNDDFLKTSPTPLSGNALTPELVDKLRFFLTTQSRAPELNLFGQPRITVWPVRFENRNSESTTGLNPFDNVILFCSTVGTSTLTYPNMMLTPSAANPIFRYIFTRRELPTLTSATTKDATGMQPILPAPVATWSSASSWVPDIKQPRNKQLIAYLQKLTNTSIPGFGLKFTDAASLGTDNRNQLLTEIFDYILCANLIDTTTKNIDGTSTAKPFANRGIAMPSRDSSTSTAVYPTTGTLSKGFGRFPTISEATLVFYYAGPKLVMSTPADSPIPPNKWIADVDATGRPTHRRMGAFLLLSTFNPMQGYGPITDPQQYDPKISFEINGGLAAFTVNGSPLGFLAGDPYKANTPLSTTVYRCSNGTWGGRNLGGYEGFMHTLAGQNSTWAPYKIKGGNSGVPSSTSWRVAPGSSRTVTSATNAEALPLPDSGDANDASNTPGNAFNNQEWYQFQTANLVEVPTANTTFSFNGGPVQVTVKYGGVEVQKVTLNFENGNSWPVPQGDPTTAPDGSWNNINLKLVKVNATTTIDLRNPDDWPKVGGATNSPIAIDPAVANTWLSAMKSCYWDDNGGFLPNYVSAGPIPANYHYQTSIQAAWSFASRLSWSMQQSNEIYRNPWSGPILNYYGNRWRQIVQPGDTIRSIVYSNGGSTVTAGDSQTGDLRLLAASVNATTGFYPHPDYLLGKRRATSLTLATGTMYFPPGSPVAEGAPSAAGKAALTPITDSPFGNHVQLKPGTAIARFYQKNIALKVTERAMPNLANLVGTTAVLSPPKINGIERSDGKPGDFDTGTGIFCDGPYINKQDEGNVIFAYQDIVTGEWHYPVPYYDSTWQYEKPGNTFTSPSRQMPSPGMFGSLPRRAFEGKPWETLCFSPTAAGIDHPGNPDDLSKLKDHLLLDLFQMPVVEPYPISEPFSTAGKVNMNYGIAPFFYITRSTALRAALHPTRITAIDADAQYYRYKTGDKNSGSLGAVDQYDVEKNQNKPVSDNYRQTIDRDKTVESFDQFFAKSQSDPDDGFFKSATQICERYLFPFNTSTVTDDATARTWWQNRPLSGDNVREKPYVDLLPRLTTKSNTYTVHVRVQTLRQLPRTTATDYDKWDEGRDAILGDYRGSTTIERYIDPGDTRFNYGTATSVNPDTDSLEPLYRFRTVINKKFAP